MCEGINSLPPVFLAIILNGKELMQIIVNVQCHSEQNTPLD